MTATEPEHRKNKDDEAERELDLGALLDLFERSRSWDDEMLRQADPLFLLLRARLLGRLEKADAAKNAGGKSPAGRQKA